jgi:hypothetical protein
MDPDPAALAQGPSYAETGRAPQRGAVFSDSLGALRAPE